GPLSLRTDQRCRPAGALRPDPPSPPEPELLPPGERRRPGVPGRPRATGVVGRGRLQRGHGGRGRHPSGRPAGPSPAPRRVVHQRVGVEEGAQGPASLPDVEPLRDGPTVLGDGRSSRAWADSVRTVCVVARNRAAAPLTRAGSLSYRR